MLFQRLGFRWCLHAAESEVRSKSLVTRAGFKRNYDALFDKHFISFDDSGNIIISSAIDPSQLGSLGISTEAKVPVTDLMRPYLARH